MERYPYADARARLRWAQPFVAMASVLLATCRPTGAPSAGKTADGGTTASMSPADDGSVAVGDAAGDAWQNVTLGACSVLVASDPARAALPLRWTPCSNGAEGCLELEHPSNPPGAPYAFAYGHVSHDSQGLPALLKVSRALSGTLFEDDVYDLRAQAPLGAARTDTSSACAFVVTVGASHAGILGIPSPGHLFYGAQGPASTVLPNPSFAELSGTDTLVEAQERLASDVLVAFDSPVAGAIVRWPLGAATVVISKPPHVPLLLDVVEGGDVYALSVHGTAGWQQEYVVQPDGTVVLYRSPPSTHASAFATDGKTMFWIESSGAAASSTTQPIVAIWQAPYTSDPATLSSTASKLAGLPASAVAAVAFQSLYAVVPPPFDVAYVVSLADGSVQRISAGAGWVFSAPLMVTGGELWAVMNDTRGGFGVALARFAR